MLHSTTATYGPINGTNWLHVIGAPETAMALMVKETLENGADSEIF